jgi:hypothetical protein
MRSMKTMLAMALAAMAVGCSSEGTTATFKIQDAPPEGVTSVKVTIATAEAHVVDTDKAKDTEPSDTSIDDSSGWVTLDINKTIDLMAHQGESAAETLGELGLPEGKITMLRLKLDTTKPENNTLTKDGTVCNLDVTKVEKKGIKINKVFKAFESKGGTKSEIYFDFDLGDSLKAQKDTACGFEFKPVIKLHKVKKDGADVATD